MVTAYGENEDSPPKIRWFESRGLYLVLLLLALVAPILRKAQKSVDDVIKHLRGLNCLNLTLTVGKVSSLVSLKNLVLGLLNIESVKIHNLRSQTYLLTSYNISKLLYVHNTVLLKALSVFW